MTGQAIAVVVDQYAFNPWGLNALTFYYQVSLTASSPVGEVVKRLTMGSFGGVLTDVGYQAISGEIIPITATRSGGAGNTVAFDFTSIGGLAPGKTTAILVINTNATTYKEGTLTVQNGITANLNVLHPTRSSPSRRRSSPR